MRKLLLSVLTTLFFLGSCRTLQAQETESDLYIELSESSARVQTGHGLQFIYGYELLNPYVSQNTFRFTYEFLFEEFLFAQVEITQSFSEYTQVLEKTEVSFINNGYSLSAKRAKTSFGANVGIAPIQLLANFGFLSKVIPLDFRVVGGGGSQSYYNSSNAFYLCGKIEAVLGISNQASLHLAFRETFSQPFSDNWESRGDLELGLGWRF